MRSALPRSVLAGAAVLAALTAAACGSSITTSSPSGTGAGGTGTTTGSATASDSTSTAPASGDTAGAGATPGPVEGAPTATLGDPCAQATFGPALAPLNPPADRHVYATAPALSITTSKLYEATISTARGPIVLCLQPQLAPATVNNFVALARNHFFDGLTFHRVVADFVIQGGDPLGNGMGGPGYTFPDERVQAQYRTGAVAMANAGPDTNGSQFFICIGGGQQCASLPPRYNLFGAVHAGQDVANRIAMGDTVQSVKVSAQS